MASSLEEITRWAAGMSRLWLFLDYDGTLAEFPSLPGMIKVQPEVVSLVQKLASHPRIRIAVISGRRLQELRVLLPVQGIFLAGIYGLEILTPAGELIHRGDYGLIRPLLERTKHRWEKLIANQPGFFLEDKDWSLALHARAGKANLAGDVLSAAQRNADKSLPPDLFRQFVDHDFLEVVPLQAHKGGTVRYLLGQFPFPDAGLLFIGDDDKDLEAFTVIHFFGGFNILVSYPSRPVYSPDTDFVLKSPRSVHIWLENLLDHGWDPGSSNSQQTG